MEFLLDTSIWYAISFVTFIFILVKFGGKSFIGFLDMRIADIRKDIETAETLRIEAQELLAQYQRKQKDAEKEADAIIQNAKEHAKQIQKDATAELKAISARKETQLKERLKRMEEDARQDIRAYAAELAVQATTEIVNDNIDKKTGAALVDQSIDNITARLK
jgi:F-type H+-transporting ATPase subunit b